MKTELENLQGHFKKISIEVPHDLVNSAIEKQYKQIQKTANLKGFRQGKAPLEMIKKLYGDSALNNVAQDLVETSLPKALEEHKLNPVNMPQIEVHNFKPGEAFKFSAQFENTPPINLKDYKSFKTKIAAVEVSEKDISLALENIRGYFATMKDAEEGTALENGKIAKISYKASEAGKDLPEASDSDVTLELGNGSIPAEFEEKIMGMKAGESKNFTVKFAQATDDNLAAPLAGRTIDFSANLHSIQIKELPVLDEELAKKLGAATVEDLKTRVKTDLEAQKKQTRHNQLQEEAVKFLIDSNPVDVPETMLNAQMEQLAVDAGMQLQNSGLNETQIEERLKEWADEMQTRAIRQVKASLLLSAIAREEKIQAAQDDVRNEIMRIAQSTRQSPQEVLKNLEERKLMGGLIRQVTELKALDWVVNQATGEA